MNARPVKFFSDRLQLDGELYLPEGAPPLGGWPAVVTCSGYQGLKEIHPARFARALTPLGYACLGFDYRGFGYSEGERGRLVPQEQVEDVRAAVSFVEAIEEVDASRIVLIGWALGGGVVIAEAADDQRVRAVVALNAIGDGYRSTRFMHDGSSWEHLLEMVEGDRRHRATFGRSRVVHPFDVVRLDKVTTTYVEDELYRAAGFARNGVSLEAADFLLRFRPEDVVDRIAPRPLLLVHGEQNILHSPEESRALYAKAGEPKHLEVLPGAGHTEWMFDDHPTFVALVSTIERFLGEALGAEPAPAS